MRETPNFNFSNKIGSELSAIANIISGTHISDEIGGRLIFSYRLRCKTASSSENDFRISSNASF